MLKKLIDKVQALNGFYTHLFMTAMFILSFIFFNVVITTTLFIFKVSINVFTPIIAAILSIVATAFWVNKKDKLKNVLPGIVIALLVIVTGIWINGKVLDSTWDGNSYQKATIGMLAKGWNPLYEHLEEFDENSLNKIGINDESPIYINHYARAASIYAANIYNLTGNIETGKSINTLSIIMIFLFTLSFLMYKKKNIIFSVLFSICVATYPVACAQFLTNYLDVLVYAFLYLLILSFFVMEEKEFDIDKKAVNSMYFMILILCINIKVSLFGYAGIFCLGYYIWYVYRYLKNNIDKKRFWNFTIISIACVLLGVFVVGLSVYPKNFIDHGHPFYPLMGEGKVDIMTQNQPDYFKNKSPIEKFIISTFSKVDDIIAASKETAEFKIPFTIHDGELFFTSLFDTRISGNGVLFSGILLLSLAVILLNIKGLYKGDNKTFALCAIPGIITICMIFVWHEAWWARYYPQIYFIVLFAILALNSSEKKFVKCLQYVLICLVLVNNFITFSQAVNRCYERNVVFNSEFKVFEDMQYEDGANIEIYTLSFHGAKYNILDKYGKYNITFKSEKSDTYDETGTFFGGYLEWRYVNE